MFIPNYRIFVHPLKGIPLTSRLLPTRTHKQGPISFRESKAHWRKVLISSPSLTVRKVPSSWGDRKPVPKK